MNVYLSARYSRQVELRGYLPMLESAGLDVCSRWLTSKDPASAVPIGDADVETTRSWQAVAQRDYADMLCANALIHFSDPPGSAQVGGGRHVEFGIALALGIPIVVVGPREHVFHYIGDHLVRHVNSVVEAIELLKWTTRADDPATASYTESCTSPPVSEK